MPRPAALFAAVATFGLVVAGAAPARAAFQIVINPNSTLASNPAALAAFNRAAAQWQVRFTDDITVTIDAGLTDLGATTRAQSNQRPLYTEYSTIRAVMVADASDEPSNAIVQNLPMTMPTFLLPSGFVTDGVSLTKANAKALGIVGLDEIHGETDAVIRFSSEGAFDYDNSNGVGSGLIDFESAAAREIGHALGFISDVDYVDANTSAADVAPTTLDFFRFRNGLAGSDLNSAADFSTAARDMTPGTDAIFDDGVNEYRFSTGVAKGDGNMAGYWKDNLGLGIMDPTLGAGEIGVIRAADLRAFDLIGWDLNPAYVPEPTTLAALGGIAIVALRRRRATHA